MTDFWMTFILIKHRRYARPVPGEADTRLLHELGRAGEEAERLLRQRHPSSRTPGEAAS